jgi:ectoine hydroxylase-related dioxygenase (phytanoyl-CoA dioxygenase family)
MGNNKRCRIEDARKGLGIRPCSVGPTPQYRLSLSRSEGPGRKHQPLDSASTLVAPRTSSHSNAWTKGPIHRDFDDIETTGVYSFLLFLDEVTSENGTVAFWRHSKLIGPIHPRHPERALDQAGLTSELLVGEEGTVYVWDSRLLHRSLANRTQKRRLALQWLVTSSGKNGVSLSITT